MDKFKNCAKCNTNYMNWYHTLTRSVESNIIASKDLKNIGNNPMHTFIVDTIACLRSCLKAH